MATLRVSVKQVKSVQVEDKKTWPVDLQVWVELSILKPWKEWDAPFYLTVDQVKLFKKAIAEALEAKQKKMTARFGPTYCHASN
jgi:hypothetical protein